MQDIKDIKTTGKKNNISDEINAVLLQGESGAFQLSENDEDTEDEEDVKRPADYTIPKEGVKITLPGTSVLLKKKTASKKESDLAAILRRKLKANQIFVEKVSRLCWLAHGFYLNRQASDPEIMTTAVSLVPTNNYPKDKLDFVYLEKFTKWFRNIFTSESINNDITINKVTLLKRIAEKKIFSYRELVVLYVAVLRAIGLNCRLIVSLNPPPVKAYTNLLSKTSAPKKTDQAKEKPKETKTKAKSSKPSSSKQTDSKKDLDNDVIQNSESGRKNANLAARKRAAEILHSKYSYSKKDKNKLNNSIAQNNTVEVEDDKVATTSVKKADTVTSSRSLRSTKLADAASSTTKQRSNKNNSSENNQSKASSSKRKTQIDHSDSSSGEEEEKKVATSKTKKKRAHSNKTQAVVKSKKKSEKKEEASEEGEEEETDAKNKIKNTQDVWAEVYVESKGSWISVNVIDGNVDCVAEVYVSNSSNNDSFN